MKTLVLLACLCALCGALTPFSNHAPNPRLFSGPAPLAGSHESRADRSYYIVNETYPFWWDCVNSTSVCPGTRPPCGPMATGHKAIIRDLMEASYYGNYRWAHKLLEHAKTLLVMPANFSVVGHEEITLFFTAFNTDGTRTNRYVLPDGYWVSPQLQRGLKVSSVANATAIALFNPSTYTAIPHLWNAKFDDLYQIKHLQIYIDPVWYPTLQVPPSFTEYAIVNTSKPPDRAYDACVGSDRECPGYDEPCQPEKLGIIHLLTEFLLLNITEKPVYDQVFTFFSDQASSVAPYLSSFIQGNAVLATYYEELNPYFGDPSYTYPYLVPGYWDVDEGNMSIITGTYQVHFWATDFTTYMTLFWVQTFDDTRRLSYYTVEPDTALILEQLSDPNLGNVTYICEIIAGVCVGDLLQYPVASGPFKGLDCPQYLGNSTFMPIFDNDLGVASDFGCTASCHGFHAEIARQGGIGSLLAQVHCWHAGALPANPNNGAPDPCYCPYP